MVSLRMIELDRWEERYEKVGGLSVSYGIIERYGSSLEAQSEAEKGGTFTITLPNKKVET